MSYGDELKIPDIFTVKTSCEIHSISFYQADPAQLLDGTADICLAHTKHSMETSAVEQYRIDTDLSP